jgi:AraC-like DNA-binding protein
VGDFLLTDNEELLMKKADFPEIFWCVEGIGNFWLEGKLYQLHPGQVWYYPPGSFHLISCYGKLFHYRWITVDGPDARVLFEGWNLKPGINHSGECPQHLFNNIRLNIETPTQAAQLENLKTVFEILGEAATPGGMEKSGAVEQVKQLIEENFQNPELNVEKIAELLQINRSVLSRLFSAKEKITIVQYLSNFRLEKAIYLIKATDLPIQKIAKVCGYSCHNYFSKVIRRHTGKTPALLRRM